MGAPQALDRSTDDARCGCKALQSSKPMPRGRTHVDVDWHDAPAASQSMAAHGHRITVVCLLP